MASLNTCHNMVPITTKTGYETPASSILTTLLPRRKIHKAAVASGGRSAQAKPQQGLPIKSRDISLEQSKSQFMSLRQAVIRYPANRLQESVWRLLLNKW